jgi:hypothetical protein
MGEKCAHKEKSEVWKLTPPMQIGGVDKNMSDGYQTS